MRHPFELQLDELEILNLSFEELAAEAEPVVGGTVVRDCTPKVRLRDKHTGNPVCTSTRCPIEPIKDPVVSTLPHPVHRPITWARHENGG